MNIKDLSVAILYGAFLILSSLYFILAGSAFVDYLGIDRHIPSSIAPTVVALVSSFTFTALSSIPLVLTKKKGMREAVFILFLVSFTFYSVIILFFLGFK
ncbi:hypothetical protein [Thermococcus sp.]